MIVAPFIFLGLICNLIYCAAKIHRDIQNGQAAFGIVGLIGIIGSTGLAIAAITAIILTSNGELT